MRAGVHGQNIIALNIATKYILTGFIRQQLATSAYQGIIIGLAVALPILIVATMNFIVGLLATLTISLVAFSVVAFIPILGWKLGVSIISKKLYTFTYHAHML